MFADDTSLTAAGETLSEIEKRANEDLRNVHNWLSANKLNLNIAKTEYVLIGSRHRINSLDIQPSINIDKQSVKRVKHSKVLGVQVDEHLAWTKYIEFIAGKISSGIGAIKKAKEFVDRNTLVLIYNALVQPHFDYCCEAWDVLGKTLSDRLQKLQDRAARIIMNFKNESGQSLLARNSLGWINLEERRAHIKAKLMYKSINNLAPERLSNLFQNSNTIYDYDLRGSSTRLCLPRPKAEFMKKSFSYNGAYVWNHIPENMRTSMPLNCSKLYADLPGYISPSVVTGDTLRPDLVLTIENKCIYILELTVGFESNLLANARRKREKYQDLVNEQLKKYEKAQFVNVSISSLGVLSETSLSLMEMLKDLEFDEVCRKYLVRKIVNTCIRSTYYIFCKRNKVWDNPELMSY